MGEFHALYTSLTWCHFLGRSYVRDIKKEPLPHFSFYGQIDPNLFVGRQDKLTNFEQNYLLLSLTNAIVVYGYTMMFNVYTLSNETSHYGVISLI